MRCLRSSLDAARPGTAPQGYSTHPGPHAGSPGTSRDRGWLLPEICGSMICVTASTLICATARKAPGLDNLLLDFPQTRLLIIISAPPVLVLPFGKLFIPWLDRARTWQTAAAGGTFVISALGLFPLTEACGRPDSPVMPSIGTTQLVASIIMVCPGSAPRIDHIPPEQARRLGWARCIKTMICPPWPSSSRQSPW